MKMERKVFLNIAKHISKKSVTFCGLGEPLLHPNFLEFVDICKSKEAHVGFSTNGVLLNEKMARELVDLNVDEITFSIDGIGEMYEKIRKGSEFDLVVKNMKKLHELKGGKAQKPLLKITFVGLTENIEQFPRVIEFFSPFVVEVRFNHVAPYSQEIADQHAFKVPKTKIQKSYSRAIEIAGKVGVQLRLRPFEPRPDKVCWEPWTNPYIATDGTVYPCCILGDHHNLNFTEYFEDAPISYNLNECAMGNVEKQGLNEIWNNEKFRAFRSKLRGLWKQSLKKWTVKEYVELRKRNPSFFCEICSFRWGCVC